MKKNFKSTIKCLLVSLCLAGVGAFMFASMGHAEGTIQSTESQIGDSAYHESTGYNYNYPYWADHNTTEWQELGSTDVRDSAFYEEHPGGTGDYGVSWSTDGTNFGHDDLYVGDTVTFKFNMHSENVGNHYANILKGWIDWNTSDTTYNFEESDSVVEGFKLVRADNGGSVSSDYTFDSGYDDDDSRDYYGYGNDNYTVFSEEITLTQAHVGTAYLRARVTCSHSIIQDEYKYSSDWEWNAQWAWWANENFYLNAFDAYSDYGQGEIEDWKLTVSGNPPPGSPVPEPTTLALFGMGLIGLARVGRKKA